MSDQPSSDTADTTNTDGTTTTNEDQPADTVRSETDTQTNNGDAQSDADQGTAEQTSDGFDPLSLSATDRAQLKSLLTDGATAAEINAEFGENFDIRAYFDPDSAPVVKDYYTWEHFKIEFYYDDYDYEQLEGVEPTAGSTQFSTNTDTDTETDTETDENHSDGFDATHALDGVHQDDFASKLAAAGNNANAVAGAVDNYTLAPPDDLDEDAFFTNPDGTKTVVSRYDLEKEVANHRKRHFKELDRYWVNKPYAFVVIFRSTKENEVKYYMIEPYQNELELELKDYMVDKLRSSIKYAGEDAVSVDGDEYERADVIERQVREHIDRYGIRRNASNSTTKASTDGGVTSRIKSTFQSTDTELPDTTDSSSVDNDSGEPPEPDPKSTAEKLKSIVGVGDTDSSEPTTDTEDDVVDDPYDDDNIYTQPSELGDLDGRSIRPEPVLLEENDKTLTEFQIQKLIYYLKRDFVGYSIIDGVTHDINIEDISCDGYNSPVFVYHGDHEQIISNIYHGQQDLDDFVIKLAQRSGKGISKRQPQVDCSLPDGSRAQLTLGAEVSDHGTNYTIRQFKDVPFTPIDLINWNTFALEQMAFLWLAIENHKSLIFAGGTASGKTTSLNAVSLFIPSGAKIVSIEDTREVELPQRNWIASVTRPSFSEGGAGDIDEFDLLEAALRQRPDYIVMGEIRGEEGRTAFQVMSTGHTTYTTFHADSVGEVLKRFTTDPINVSKTMFTALDLVSIQTSTRVDGNKVRRNKTLTEINDYNSETDEINVQEVYTWIAENDEFQYNDGANILSEIKFDRGWDQATLSRELFVREAILAYLIKNGLNKYTQVAATFQAFINDPDTILALIANDQLEQSLEDLRDMESVSIDIDPEKEAQTPRPGPDDETKTQVDEILAEAEERIFQDYYNQPAGEISEALESLQPDDTIEVTQDTLRETDDHAGELPDASVQPDTTADTTADQTDDTDDGVSVSETDATDQSENSVDSDEANDTDRSESETDVGWFDQTTTDEGED